VISNGELDHRVIERELAQKSPVVTGLPYFYQVHLNEFCNQKCIMCKPDGKHPRAEMTLEDFTAFFGRIRGSAERLTLIGGETLMYRWFDEVIELLSHTRIAVTIITNATALTESISRRLLLLNELDLRCSINAATRQTYLKVHGTDHFERIAAQVRRFSELIQNRPGFNLIMNFVVMRENLHEVLSYVDFAEAYKPHRIEFHPVRHVSSWIVENGTGWQFRGSEQSCEAFKDEYNETMRQAKAKCEAQGMPYEIILL
jgi:molybdenum cofactor biosynthesis enzyme MoaA